MKEDGFEYKLPGDDEATFFKWSVSDGGKDLMLIDRFTQMPVHEFFQTIEDSFDRGRAPILLAIIATSIRAKHPDWTPERIGRIVQNLNLSDVEFIDADEEASVPQRAEEAPSTGGNSSATSKSSATRPDSSESEISPLTPV